MRKHEVKEVEHFSIAERKELSTQNPIFFRNEGESKTFSMKEN